MENKTLVVGASVNRGRYSNIAIQKLRNKNIEVFAIGKVKGIVADVTIEVEMIQFEGIDTVTLYVNPLIQKKYYSYLIDLDPRRVIFNPGTENMELIKLLNENNIETEVACTLVLLSTNQY